MIKHICWTHCLLRFSVNFCNSNICCAEPVLRRQIYTFCIDFRLNPDKLGWTQPKWNSIKSFGSSWSVVVNVLTFQSFSVPSGLQHDIDSAPAMCQIVSFKGDTELSSHAGQSFEVWVTDRQVGNISILADPAPESVLNVLAKPFLGTFGRYEVGSVTGQFSNPDPYSSLFNFRKAVILLCRRSTTHTTQGVPILFVITWNVNIWVITKSKLMKLNRVNIYWSKNYS